MQALACQPKPAAKAAPKAPAPMQSVTVEHEFERDRSLLWRGAGNASASASPAVPHAPTGSHFGHSIAQLTSLSRTPLSIQPKLKINQPGDEYEQEADRVAEMVMRMPEAQDGDGPFAQPGSREEITRGMHAPLSIMTKGLNGQRCDSAPSNEEEEDQQVMRQTTPGTTPRQNDVGELLARSRGGGHPLPHISRNFMEARFGHDFGKVRIHADDNEARMTQQLHAEAFATGHDIYFRPGGFAPHTASGKKLLAHELTHVVQQRGGEQHRSGGDEGGGQNFIQRYVLSGFPAAEAAAMRAAIPVAASKVDSCASVGWLNTYFIKQTINHTKYDYVPDLGLCGWTFPASWYIELGKKAFDPNVCCALASTIAHEASHVNLFTEGGARNMECACFGCSC